MSSKKGKVKFDTVEFKVYVIRYYKTLKNFADKHGFSYKTLKLIQYGDLSAFNIVARLKEIMHFENKYETEPRKD